MPKPMLGMFEMPTRTAKRQNGCSSRRSEAIGGEAMEGEATGGEAIGGWVHIRHNNQLYLVQLWEWNSLQFDSNFLSLHNDYDL